MSGPLCFSPAELCLGLLPGASIVGARRGSLMNLVIVFRTGVFSRTLSSTSWHDLLVEGSIQGETSLRSEYLEKLAFAE